MRRRCAHHPAAAARGGHLTLHQMEVQVRLVQDLEALGLHFHDRHDDLDFCEEGVEREAGELLREVVRLRNGARA